MSTNLRVELDSPSGRFKDEERAFRGMLNAFKKRVNEAGILSQWKQRQFFESKSEKSRRKRRQVELEKKKEKLREHFS
jgi:ribosomal protein S21